MLNTAISMILIAWVLSLFNFDKTFVNGIYEIFNFKMSTSGYYVIFFLTGIISGAIDYFVKVINIPNYEEISKIKMDILKLELRMKEDK